MKVSEIVRKAEMVDPTQGITVMNESFGDDDDEGLEESFTADPDVVHHLSLASTKSRVIKDPMKVLTTRDRRFLARKGYTVLADETSANLADEYKRRYPVGSHVEFSWVASFSKQYRCQGVISKYDGDEAVIKDAVIVSGQKGKLPPVLRVHATNILSKVK